MHTLTLFINSQFQIITKHSLTMSYISNQIKLYLYSTFQTFRMQHKVIHIIKPNTTIKSSTTHPPQYQHTRRHTYVHSNTQENRLTHTHNPTLENKCKIRHRDNGNTPVGKYSHTRYSSDQTVNQI